LPAKAIVPYPCSACLSWSRRRQEEPEGARKSKELLGGARRSQEEPAEPGSPSKTQEDSGGFRIQFVARDFLSVNSHARTNLAHASWSPNAGTSPPQRAQRVESLVSKNRAAKLGGTRGRHAVLTNKDSPPSRPHCRTRDQQAGHREVQQMGPTTPTPPLGRDEGPRKGGEAQSAILKARRGQANTTFPSPPIPTQRSS
jgi:hypothetical protein